MHFARVARGIILADTPLPAIQRLVPRDAMTKFEMLQCFAQHYEREDIVIEPCAAAVAVDRTLATDNAKLNAALWQDGGYSYVPTVSHMVAELANIREGCPV